jgi:hypothetical protein
MTQSDASLPPVDTHPLRFTLFVLLFVVKTWKGEHFEYHGQCDMILTKDNTFANGLGLELQIRTKLVRFWSYIKRTAIRIGDDILEIEGSVDPVLMKASNHYWINFEYQGELTTLGGFPVTYHLNGMSNSKRWMSSRYPRQKIASSRST